MSIAIEPQAASAPVPSIVWPRKNLGELLHELGDIPPHRVRLYPYPGTATEADAIRATNTERPCELIDGTLVEKAMGVPESFLASLVLQFIGPFVRVNRLGITTAPDGMYRMIHGNIREPDVSFTSRARFQSTSTQVGNWCPDLCIEILSPSNTRAEMAAKRSEYFKSGCRLFWIVDYRSRCVDVCTDANVNARLSESDTLTGGDVLPGFTLSLAELFSAFDDGMKPGP
jgi:Uma2 family endonuclease